MGEAKERAEEEGEGVSISLWAFSSSSLRSMSSSLRVNFGLSSTVSSNLTRGS